MTRQEAHTFVLAQQQALRRSYASQGLPPPHISLEAQTFAVLCVIAALKQTETAK